MSPMDVVKWTISTITAGITLMYGAYTIFETRTEATEKNHSIQEKIDFSTSNIEKRLDRIEHKIDQMRR